jgi:uncharacterized membrane protein YgdD (TMEM256/DUF423 family)
MNKPLILRDDARLFLALGAIGGFFSVLLGAFAAHTLREIISPGMLQAFETGVRYQALHALALLALGLLIQIQPHPRLNLAGWAFATGILLFSGSLYTMAGVDAPWLGLVTPFGGLAFLLGWGLLAWHLLRT